jgi:Molybdopterin-binding domain of aldehyde dehydrogenase
MERGDVDAGLTQAAVRVEQTYRFAANHHNPIETSATTAVWDGDQLTLYDSTQGITATRLTVAALLGMSPTKVRVITRFVGGAFGSKAMVWPHVTLAAIAARQVGRPVKLALTRQQMFSSSGHREEQEHDVALGATRDGRVTTASVSHSTASASSLATRSCRTPPPRLARRGRAWSAQLPGRGRRAGDLEPHRRGHRLRVVATAACGGGSPPNRRTLTGRSPDADRPGESARPGRMGEDRTLVPISAGAGCDHQGGLDGADARRRQCPLAA